MSITELAKLISIMCGMSTPNLTDAQFKCLDYYVNCAVTGSGKIEEKQVKKCQENYGKEKNK